jgi:hypothetical protein
VLQAWVVPEIDFVPRAGQSPAMTILLVFLSHAIVLSVALARAGHRSRMANPSGAARQRPSRILIVGWDKTRPGALTSGERRSRYRHGGRIGSFLWTVRIARADVADFMLNQLESDTHLRTAPGICG